MRKIKKRKEHFKKPFKCKFNTYTTATKLDQGEKLLKCCKKNDLQVKAFYKHEKVTIFFFFSMITIADNALKHREHPDVAIKSSLANYLPVQLFTSCGGFMLNPVISLALQLPLSVTGSKAQRLQSAFYYTTCEWRFDPVFDHFPFWFYVSCWAFPYKSLCWNELLLFFFSSCNPVEFWGLGLGVFLFLPPPPPPNKASSFFLFYSFCFSFF